MKVRFIAFIFGSLILLGCNSQPPLPDGFELPTEPPDYELSQPTSGPNE